MSKERPIIFSAPMVLAILAGRKTMTRRILKPQPIESPGMNCRNLSWFDRKGNPRGKNSPEGPFPWIFTPHAPGDRLWVREAGAFKCRHAPIYRADGEQGGWKWQSPIHMPRGASRITLEVINVRVQWLAEISEDDATAEGVHETEFYDSAEHKVSAGAPWSPERLAFADLWNSIHGPGSWEANPWVAAITFRRVEAAERSAA